MANALIACSLSTPIRACSKPEPNRIKSPSSSSSTNWWTSLFGWSSDPDYINNNNNNININMNSSSSSSSRSDSRKQLEMVDPDNDSGRSKSRFVPGCFTEEKAKQLRRKTAESSSFHDIMYHSALASRLASDISVWSQK